MRDKKDEAAQEITLTTQLRTVLIDFRSKGSCISSMSTRAYVFAVSTKSIDRRASASYLALHMKKQVVTWGSQACINVHQKEERINKGATRILLEIADGGRSVHHTVQTTRSPPTAP